MMRRAIVWGFLLWLFGYILGFVFYAFVPQNLLGWAIMPFGILATLWVLAKKLSRLTSRQAIATGLAWVLIAIVCDYLFLVKVLHPADGYYKLDVYVYYALTFFLPLLKWRHD